MMEQLKVFHAMAGLFMTKKGRPFSKRTEVVRDTTIAICTAMQLALKNAELEPNDRITACIISLSESIDALSMWLKKTGLNYSFKETIELIEEVRKQVRMQEIKESQNESKVKLD